MKPLAYSGKEVTPFEKQDISTWKSVFDILSARNLVSSAKKGQCTSETARVVFRNTIMYMSGTCYNFDW